MILCVICFLLGICSLHFFATIPSIGLIIIFGIVNVGLYGLLKKISKKQLHVVQLCKIKQRYCLISLLYIQKQWNKVVFFINYFLRKGCLIAFYSGFLWIWIHAALHLKKSLPSDLEGKSVAVIGTITSIPETQEDAFRFEFDIQQTIPSSLWEPVGRIKVRWSNLAIKPIVGDTWQLTVKLKKPQRYANPGSFDNEKYFFQNRWVAEGYVDEKIKPILLKSHWMSRPIDRFRTLIFEKMKRGLKEKKSGGLIISLVIGIKEGISQEQWHTFRDTGTAHLMAISGLHVGLVASIFYVCVFWGYRLLPIRYLVIPAGWIAAWFALIAAIIYSFLAGFSIPTQRALVMVTLFMVNQLMYRIHITLWNYFLALGFVLLIDPFAVLSVGFWLSFGAVGIILYGMSGRLKSNGIWWKWGRAQWVVFLGLMPMTFAAFNQVSWVSPIANIIAIPWVSFGVVPFALLGTLLLPITEAGGNFVLHLSAALLSLLWPFLEKCAALPKAAWGSAEFSSYSIIWATVGVLIILAPRGFPHRLLGILWMLPLLLGKAQGVKKGEVYFTLLDVGQGLSAVVETAHHVLVFDTGPQIKPGFDTGDRVVLPFLATRGRKKVNTLVISHGDNDHIGGMQSIIKKMPVDTIITSEIDAIENHHRVTLCYATQHWQWDGVEFEMLHPDTTTTSKRNDHCCVLQVKIGQGKNQQTLLLTADIEAKSEYKLLDRLGNKLKSSVLVVPHHGSKTSSTLEFLYAVQPEYALIPAGYRNRYGHPKPEIVKRYDQQGIKVFNTIYDGAISFNLRGNGHLEPPKRYRLESQDYWRVVSK